MSLDEIAQEIAKCTKCPLSKYRRKTVPGEGNPSAKILLIGEGPGSQEDLEGRPFVGEAGKFLEEMLKEIKISRADVFITNVVKCRPPNNRDPLEDEVDICSRNYLFRQIRLIKPKLIILLGRHAMRVFFPQIRSISSVHGKAYRKGGQVYLICYHPAAALYQRHLKEAIKESFRQIPDLFKKIEKEN